MCTGGVGCSLNALLYAGRSCSIVHCHCIGSETSMGKVENGQVNSGLVVG
jgi:hypothetical protein